MNLPVAVRELRVAAAARGTFRMRVYFGLAAIVSTSWILYNLLQFSGHASTQIGREMFSLQAWAAFFLAAVGGVSATADCISREKRAGTLGLLFLTHLKGRDIVLGKLAANTIGCFSGLLATLPIISIPILMGGVQFGEFVRILTVVLDTMFFAAATGLLVSSVSRNQQRAQAFAILIVLFFTGGLTAAGQLLRYFQINPDICLAVELPNPVFAQTRAFGSLAGLQKAYFATSCGIIFGIGVLFLAAASFLTPRCWQDKGGQSLTGRLRARFADWQLGHIHSRSATGRLLLDRNPFLWLISHQSGVRTSVWLYVVLITALAAFLMIDFSRHFDPAGVRITVCIPCAYLLNIGLKVRIGGWASFRLAEARENGALELILSTPVKITELVAGQFLGLRRVFGWPILTIMLLLLLGFMLSLPGFDRLDGLFYSDPTTSTLRFRAFVLLLCSLMFLVLDATALTWCGLLFGLWSKNPGQARSFTMLLCLVVPLLLYPFLLPMLDQVQILRPFFKQPNYYIVLAFFAGVAVLADLGLILFARHQILGRAREIAQVDGRDSGRSLFQIAKSIIGVATGTIRKFRIRRDPLAIEP